MAGEPAIKGEVSDRHEEHLLFFFLVKSDLARDAALVAQVKNLGDLAIQIDLGGGSRPRKLAIRGGVASADSGSTSVSLRRSRSV
jgi:hypothetical protein